MAVAVRPQPQVRLASGLDTLAGIWMFISAFVFNDSANISWNLAIVGVIVTVLAATRAFGDYRPSWPSWVNAVLGVWILISPWVIGTMYRDVMWNCVITGLIVIVLAVWSALATDVNETPVVP